MQNDLQAELYLGNQISELRQNGVTAKQYEEALEQLGREPSETELKILACLQAQES